MNRSLQAKAFRVLLVCSFAIAGFAQSKDESAHRLGPQQWEKLPKGGEVIRLFANKELGLEWPQIAVLRLTEEQYKEFRYDPRRYLMENKVFFDAKLRRIISSVDISEDRPVPKPTQSKTQSKPDPWVIVVEHNLYCDSATIADEVP